MNCIYINKMVIFPLYKYVLTAISSQTLPRLVPEAIQSCARRQTRRFSTTQIYLVVNFDIETAFTLKMVSFPLYTYV